MRRYTTAILLILIIFIAGCSPSNPKTKTSPISYPKIGEVLKTQYFDVTVNKASINDLIDLKKEYLNVKAGKGSTFLILNVTIKNTDSKARSMYTDGTLWINYYGKDYSFENAEIVIADGWNYMADEIDPLKSKTTNIAFKIPGSIRGDTYFQPCSTEDEKRIYIGKIGSN